MSQTEVEQLVEAELARMPVAARAAVRSRLGEPIAERRSWAYGPGEFTCWCVGTDRTGDNTVVYQGDPGAFADPWGCLETGSGDMGRDDRWFASLYDAAIAAGWVDAPPGYVVE